MYEPTVEQESKGNWVFHFGSVVIRGSIDFVLEGATRGIMFASLLTQGKILAAFNAALTGKKEEDL